MADREREATYLAEDRLARVARSGAPMVVGRRLVSVEPDVKFTALSEAGLFCTLTCLELSLPPVDVRLRRGESKSHYSPARGGGTAEIALASWGAWRSVVLHELAHHVLASQGDSEVDAHGPEFRRAHLDLLVHVGLARQAQELERMFTEAGLGLA